MVVVCGTPLRNPFSSLSPSSQLPAMSLLLFSPEDGSNRLPPKQTVVNHLVREGDGSNKTQQDIISSEGMQFQGMPAHLARVGSVRPLCRSSRVSSI